VAVTYRPASLDDAEFAADVMHPVYPTDPLVTRFRWENPRKGYEAGRFIAEESGVPIAFLAWLHGPWAKLPERHCEIEVWLERSRLDAQLLVDLWSWIEAEAVAQGSLLLLAYAGEDEPETLAALASLGYTRERSEKVWILDLKRHGARLVDEAAAARKTTEGSGIRLLTVAD
jgi:hypothetical protein